MAEKIRLPYEIEAEANGWISVDLPTLLGREAQRGRKVDVEWWYGADWSVKVEGASEDSLFEWCFLEPESGQAPEGLDSDEAWYFDGDRFYAVAEVFDEAAYGMSAFMLWAAANGWVVRDSEEGRKWVFVPMTVRVDDEDYVLPMA